MPGTSNISGLSSGLNWNNIVDQLMAVEQKKVTLLQKRQQQETDRQNALNTLRTSLSTLRNDALALADASRFFTYSASLRSSTTTDPATILKATPSSTATAGSHTVVVNELASAQKLVSNAAVLDGNTGLPVTSPTSPLNLSGSFTITGQAGFAQTVNVQPTDSLLDIVDKINALNSGSNATKVTASILAVSSSAGAKDYRLVLTADEAGATKGSVGLAGADLEAGGPLAKLNLPPSTIGVGGPSDIQKQAALDATLTVDGISGIKRDTNSISDVIPGVTLDLLKKDPSTTITITTSVDQAAVKNQIQKFVDDYNAVIDFINQQVAFNADTQTAGVLAGDATVRSVQSTLAASVLQSVPGLPSDRNSLVLIGIAPDKTGKLTIDNATLDKWLATDPTAVRNVFAATASSSDPSLRFLTYGSGTTSGTYAVHITQPATQAAVTGTIDLSAGIGAGNRVAVTFTDAAGRSASLTFNGSGAIGSDKDGSSLAAIVSALNAEFATTYTEQRQMSQALRTDIGGPATYATSATRLQDLTDGTNNLNIKAGDTITISGTNRYGAIVSSTFTVLDPATDTVGDLLTAIQSAFDGQVTATIDANGLVTITDNAAGDSNLSFTLTANNEGGGMLNFGSETVVHEGRHEMALTAAAVGNTLKIQSNAYGAGNDFTITQDVDRLFGLGVSVNTATTVDPNVVKAQDVAGTIGGHAATGKGQILTGSSGNVEGLALMYSGSAPPSSDPTITLSMGIGAMYDSLIYMFTDPIAGLIQTSIKASSDVYDAIQARIDETNLRLKQERQRLISSFQHMESLMSQLNATGKWLGLQINSFNRSGK